MDKRIVKKRDIFEGIVEKTVYPCTGIVTAEGSRVLVKGAIRGQKIRFAISKVRNNKKEGRLLEVLEKAPDEIAPQCPHFGRCGGCCYQELAYDAQLDLKNEQAKELLDTAASDFEYEGILPSPQRFGYRNKMEFTFGDEYPGGPLVLGLHKQKSFHDIVPVRECRIIDEDFRKILGCTMDFFADSGIPYYHRIKHTGCLRHLLIRKGEKSGDILIDLVTTTETVIDEVAWVSKLFELELDGDITGILHTYNNSAADAILDGGTKTLYGQDHFSEELLGLTFRISPFSFFQTNSGGAEVLYEKVREYAGNLTGKTIYDLYSGTGTISQVLSPVADQVVGIEIVEEAVEAAKENAKENGLYNCTFLAGDVLKTLDAVEIKPDIIILDPPREGVHPKALKKIIEYGTEHMIYISCKPTSLVRDLAVLKENGYRLQKAAAVDLFPWAQHVETVVLLSQLKVDDHIEVDLDLDELDVTSAESIATYNEIQQYVLK